MVAITAYPSPIAKPSSSFPLTDSNGVLTQYGQNTLLSMWSAINGANFIVPCLCDQTATNTLALTPLVTSPVPILSNAQAQVYTVFSTWAFVAVKTSTGNLSASVSPLGVLNVYKAQGATRATTGDVVLGSQYFLTYVDTLNANAGGFVLR